MIFIINRAGEIKRMISNSRVPQKLNQDEFELKVIDQNIIDAFNRGEEILYNKNTGKVYYEPNIEIDTEKAVLYEAVANLFEEIQVLKAQLGGEK